ncbi:TlpA family protein disulfide reductase [Nocardia transvalensis]|uniref:TlpA family protein disulfide reductase n=1 Tax=Nocardia transvalensis TaxID=37333 RepID=UPI003A5D0D1E
MVALAVAIWPRGDHETPTATTGSAPPPSSAVSPEQRAAAALAPCPAPAATAAASSADPQAAPQAASSPPAAQAAPSAPAAQASLSSPAPLAGQGALAGLTLGCLADGRPVDLGAALAGRPALLNLWSYWCEPCAHELPALQEFAARAGAAITVLTVHSDPDEAKALARLTDLQVHLPGVEDGAAQVRNAVRAPAVQPVSVLIRADGSVAKLVVRPFRDVDDIAATVAAELGVTA